MIDFVHLDDILVMFPSGTARMQSAKVPQINIIAGNVPRHPVFKSTGSGVLSSQWKSGEMHE
jgi:hypothetical protein